MFYYNYIRLIFSNLVGSLPLLLVWFGGAGFAIARWKWHPRVSKLALAGFLLLILEIILNTVWFAIFADLSVNSINASQFVYAVDMASSLIFFTLRLAGFVLVILAIYQGRAEYAAVKQMKTEEAAS